MDDDFWPFDQPRNCATFTLRSIIFDGGPILAAFHDADDHGWQFLDGKPAELANAALVCLQEIVRHDPTVLEIADLPPGWCAWREAPGSPWQRAPDPTE
jgi:hypothetical protein